MINVNCHSSINIYGSKNIWIDPFKLDVVSEKADIILITHPHYDHYSPEDIEKIICDRTIMITPKKTSPSADYELSPGDKINIGGCSVESVPAYNINKRFHPKGENWIGYIINIDGIKYYICGDSDATEEAKRVKCDVLFVPCGGTYTMDYNEAAELTNTIHPHLVVPTHYGSVADNKEDGNNFKKCINNTIKCELFY